MRDLPGQEGGGVEAALAETARVQGNGHEPIVGPERRPLARRPGKHAGDPAGRGVQAGESRGGIFETMYPIPGFSLETHRGEGCPALVQQGLYTG